MTVIGGTYSHSLSESLLLLSESVLLVSSSVSHNGRLLCLIVEGGGCRGCCGRGDGFAGDATVVGGTYSHSLSDSSVPREDEELEDDELKDDSREVEDNEDEEDDEETAIGLLIIAGLAARGRACGKSAAILGTGFAAAGLAGVEIAAASVCVFCASGITTERCALGAVTRVAELSPLASSGATWLELASTTDF